MKQLHGGLIGRVWKKKLEIRKCFLVKGESDPRGPAIL